MGRKNALSSTPIIFQRLHTGLVVGWCYLLVLYCTHFSATHTAGTFLYFSCIFLPLSTYTEVEVMVVLETRPTPNFVSSCPGTAQTTINQKIITRRRRRSHTIKNGHGNSRFYLSYFLVFFFPSHRSGSGDRCRSPARSSCPDR